jgi:hypothetical protein
MSEHHCLRELGITQSSANLLGARRNMLIEQSSTQLQSTQPLIGSFPVVFRPFFGSWRPLTGLRSHTYFRHTTLGETPLDE